MSEPEKPLHVRVAEALGWRAARPPREHEQHGQWVGESPRRSHWGADIIPRYDESWKHTGPLIERYGITLDRYALWEARVPHEPWCGEGETALVAVCELILALAKAGKLPRP